MENHWQECRERNATGRPGKGMGQTQTNDEVNKVVVCEDVKELNENIDQVKGVEEENDDVASDDAEESEIDGDPLAGEHFRDT